MTETNPPLLESLDDPHLDLAALSGEIAAQLSVVQPTLERSQAMARRLFSRAKESAFDHRGFVTVRREDVNYSTVAQGARAHTLRSDAAVSIVLVQLDSGAALPWPDGVASQEVLVLKGSLDSGGAEVVTQYQLRLQHQGDATLRAGVAGAQLYVRQLISRNALLPAELTWWISPADAVSPGWLPLSEGVDLKSLRCVGDVVSKLARVAPGATVGNHGHAIDEDCMMLEGDLFLGDILLRHSDYQLAPAGGEHVNSMSDTGALFYFHGCLPGLHR